MIIIVKRNSLDERLKDRKLTEITIDDLDLTMVLKFRASLIAVVDGESTLILKSRVLYNGVVYNTRDLRYEIANELALIRLKDKDASFV